MSLAQTEAKLVDFLYEVQELMNNGMTLKQLNKWSYEQREAGRDIPYLSWGTKRNDPKEAYLVPAPIKKQADYVEYFNVTHPGQHLPIYSLYIFQNEVQFYRKEKEKVNGKIKRFCIFSNTEFIKK